MWPNIPENLQALSASALRALSRDIKAAATKALLSPELNAESRVEVDRYLGIRDEVIALAAAKDADTARLAALAADEADEDPAPAEEPPAPSTEAATDEPAVDEPAADEEDPELQGKAPKVGFGMKSKPAAPAKPASTLEMLYATDGVAGHAPGEGFESWADLAKATVARAQNIRANASEKFEVARIRAEYPQDRILGDSAVLNMAKFEPDEIQAALCAPATPYYGLACANVLRRPVFNSLPQFQAPRMKVSIPESPSLSDITTGVGVWTADDDADINAVKEACQTITCGTPTEYVMYGVYRCLTVKNMLAMSYPELVEAWLNRLGAAHARLAEQRLLNLMATGTVEINAPALGYGGSVSITSTIMNYLALYNETERWDVPPMQGWIPRWVMWAMKMDLMRRRRTAGEFSVPSDAQINSLFTEVGVTPHWYMDTPSYAVAIPSVASGGNLNRLPASVQILLAPAGKFAVMDRGELAIGVTGNNIYRDNQSNSRNEFTFFFENFEGIVNTTSCPAHILDIPAHWNGVQIDDIVINAQGGDEVGYQS